MSLGNRKVAILALSMLAGAAIDASAAWPADKYERKVL